MCFCAKSSATPLVTEIEGSAKAVHCQIHIYSKSNCCQDQVGGKGILLMEHWRAQDYFDLFSAAIVALKYTGQFYIEFQ